MTRDRMHTKMAAVLGAVVIATVLGAVPASAAAPPPTVTIDQADDGYINAAEEGAVTLSGTYSLLAIPPITAIKAKLVSNGICSNIAPDTPELTATLNLDGTWTAGPFSLALFSQGPICARAQAEDMNGPGGIGTSAPAIRDTIAPAGGTVSIDDAPDGVITDSDVAAGVDIAWSTGGAAVAARISFADALNNVPAACEFTDNPNSLPGAQMSASCLNALPDGPFQMRGVWLDEAGNESGVASYSSILDTVAPAIGLANLVDPNFDGYANKEEVQAGQIVAVWSNADPDAVSSEILFRDAFGAIHGPECGLFPNPPGGNHVLTQACANKMAQGPFEFAVSWFDLGGNETPEAKDSLILDTIMPVLTITEPLEGSYQPSTVVVRGISDANVAMTFKLDAGTPVSGTSNPDGTFSHTFTNVPDGPHFVTVTATDVAANTIAMGANFIVDRLIPYIRNPAEGSAQPQVVTFNGTGLPDADVELYEGTELIGITEVAANGEWHTTVALPEGPHAVRARGIGIGGSPVSELGPVRNFIVVPAPPQVFIDTEDMALNPLQIKGTASAPKGVARIQLEYFDAIGGAKLGDATADCYKCGDGQLNPRWIHRVPDRFSVAMVRVEVTAYDTAGQPSAKKAIRFLYYHKL